MEPTYFDCACGDLNHVFRFVLDPVDGETWLEARLNPYLPWYLRAREAFAYVLGIAPKRAQFDVTILRPEDIDRLRLFADQVSEAKGRYVAHKVTREKPVTEESR